jgi:hypothetical protein
MEFFSFELRVIADNFCGIRTFAGIRSGERRIVPENREGLPDN